MLPTTTIPNSGATSGGGAKTAAVDQLLPAGGREVAAVVRQVAAGDLGGQVFRIQVEANNRLLELITRAPLNNGDRITLSRTPGGEVQLSLPAPSPPPAAPSAQARPALLLQAAAAQTVQLLQTLPLNHPQSARVISSTPAPPGGAPASPPVAPSAPITTNNSGATATVSSATATATLTASAPTTPASASPAARGKATTGSTAAPSTSPAGAPAPSVAAVASAPTHSAQRDGHPRPAADTRSPPATGEPRLTGDRPPSQPPAAGAVRAQVYTAQLQQISQLGSALQAGAATSSPPATPAGNGGTPAQAPAPQTTAPPPRTLSAASTATHPAEASTPAPTRQTPPPHAPATPRAETTATPPPNPRAAAPVEAKPQPEPAGNSPSANRETASTPPAARVSLTGSTLLQTLGQQQPRQPIQHLVQLSLGNQQLQLVSPRPLQAGQQVTLTRVGDQQVQLQGASPAAPPGRSPTAQSAMQQALREALPHQLPFGDALNQLVQLSQTPAVRGQGAIGQLVQSMLSLFSVTPGSPDAEQAIQRNLQQGGLLTESQLARSSGSDKPPTDLKQQLGQLLKAAEQLPTEPRQQMQRLVEALQARTTSQQVSSLQAWQELPDGGQERVFRLDLPIRQAERHDTAELTISEQRRPGPDGDWQSCWSVALNFDLQQQGSVDVRLSLQEGWRLQLQFWAEEAATLRRIEQQLDPFAQELHQKGFIIDRIQARQGKPHQPKLNDIQRRLVDVHT